MSEPAGPSEPVVLHGVGEVLASTGTALGPSDWVEITPERLDAWEAACPGSPVGWLLLSLTNLFMPEMIRVEDVSAGLNIGTGEVRFAEGLTLVAGARVRARGEVTSVTEPRPGSAQTTIRITVESATAPLVTVDAISRWLA